MKTTTRRAVGIMGAALTLLAAAGCSGQVPTESTPAATTTAPGTPAPAAGTPEPASTTTPKSGTTTGLSTVAGYAEGEFPPVPLFRLPDLSLLDASTSSFTIEIRDDFATIPGVTVSGAQCDGGGNVIADNGSAYLYGDGSGNYTGTDGTIQNYGDGSGSFTLNGVTVENYGDGSGSYDDGTVSIQNYGDGSGNYSDGTMSVHVYGDGSGSYVAGAVRIQNYGDGSGSYEEGSAISIHNYGDGSGSYSDANITIDNYGDGTGAVDGVPIEVEPIATVPKLGVFPALGTLQPIESCGTILTFQDGVLFDFDRSDVRTDAVATLQTVAAALTEYDIPQAIVSGHTDAIGSDSYNQTLSEDRAASVVAALEQAGVVTALTAEGYGERQPVAANEINGQDNPAGRQLNRRVEIFIPASF